MIAWTDRVVTLAVPATRAASLLLVGAGFLLIRAVAYFARASQPVLALFFLCGALAFVGFGLAALLYHSRWLHPVRRALLRPVLLLGSIAASLGGMGWMVSAVLLWQETGRLEAYGIVLGLVLAVQGSLTFWTLGWRLPGFSRGEQVPSA